MSLIASLLLLTSTFNLLVNGAHYKGGVFTSIMPDNETISFRFQAYYIRSGPGSAIWCDDTTISSQKNVTDGSVSSISIAYCDSSTAACSASTSVPFYFRCLNYAITNNWSQFENTVNVTLDFTKLQTYDSVKFFLVSSGQWDGFAYTYSWSHINRVVFSNTPPNVISFPTLNIKCGCEIVFKPLIVDTDSGDFIKCRKANYTLKESPSAV